MVREGRYIAGLLTLSLLVSLGIKALGLQLSGTGSGAIALTLTLLPASILGIALVWRATQVSSDPSSRS